MDWATLESFKPATSVPMTEPSVLAYPTHGWHFFLQVTLPGIGSKPIPEERHWLWSNKTRAQKNCHHHLEKLKLPALKGLYNCQIEWLHFTWASWFTVTTTCSVRLHLYCNKTKCHISTLKSWTELYSHSHPNTFYAGQFIYTEYIWVYREYIYIQSNQTKEKQSRMFLTLSFSLWVGKKNTSILS